MAGGENVADGAFAPPAPSPKSAIPALPLPLLGSINNQSMNRPGQEKSENSGKNKISGNKSNKSSGNKANRNSTRKRNNLYVKRVDEVSAGGLVIDRAGVNGLLIGRIDLKSKNQNKILWSLPKGHIEDGETPEVAALREVKEETGVSSEINKSIGVIDFWFMAGGKRIHKTVHHFLFTETGGELKPQPGEVDEVAWFPLSEIVKKLAYSDERKLISKAMEMF